MPFVKAEIRAGAYYDSVVLMQLQRSLAALPGVKDAGVVMGTPANKDMLAQSGMLTSTVAAARPDDLIVVVSADDESAAAAALAQVNDLLARRKPSDDQEFRPLSLETAAQILPDAQWVLVSVAGRYAAGLARQALRLGKNVFLFSDNVSIEEEIALKRQAAQNGLLVMGPDCGTALICGIGMGFANKVRPGPIGVIAAAGTGLQQVTSRIHQLGSGITHGIGTGGRDLSERVGGTTALQALELFSRDPETQVIVIVSKPPAPQVAENLLRVARTVEKPVVVNMIGRPLTARQIDNLYYATTLDEAARIAVDLVSAPPAAPTRAAGRFAPGQRFLRGLYSGGTLAYEAQYILQGYLPRVWSNAPLRHEDRLPNSLSSQEHTIVDLGEDEFTVGRLHPMLDNELRIRRLLQEAQDPETAVIMLDVVLGYGAHPDPAGELAPAIAQACATAQRAGRHLEVIAVVTGTDLDPQKLDEQIQKLKQVRVRVETSNEAAAGLAGRMLRAMTPDGAAVKPIACGPGILRPPLAAINVGLESFATNLAAQGAPVVSVEWRPPAGGNERLIGILERMKA